LITQHQYLTPEVDKLVKLFCCTSRSISVHPGYIHKFTQGFSRNTDLVDQSFCCILQMASLSLQIPQGDYGFPECGEESTARNLERNLKSSPDQAGHLLCCTSDSIPLLIPGRPHANFPSEITDSHTQLLIWLIKCFVACRKWPHFNSRVYSTLTHVPKRFPGCTKFPSDCRKLPKTQ
jgi:hypothetical protein